MLFKLFYCTVLISLTVSGEPPVQRRAPYAASGWRPQRPFHLPGEYLPPRPPPAEVAEPQRQAPVEFEIRKARVDFVGQVQQELPFEQNNQFFPATTNQQTRKPASKYGPPQPDNFNIANPDPRSLEESAFTSGGDVADFDNAENKHESMAQDYASEDQTNTRQGQYFVLGPDNKVQRVIFTTSQDEEEQRSNGFTAQLKYTPVGELKDPVYRYNNKGQLIRVLKK